MSSCTGNALLLFERLASQVRLMTGGVDMFITIVGPLGPEESRCRTDHQRRAQPMQSVEHTHRSLQEGDNVHSNGSFHCELEYLTLFVTHRHTCLHRLLYKRIYRKPHRIFLNVSLDLATSFKFDELRSSPVS